MIFKSNFVCIVFLVLSVWLFYSYFDSISYAQPSSLESANDSLIDTIKFEGRTGTIAVNQKTNTIYVTNPTAGTVSIIDGTTNKIVDVFDVEKSAFGIGVNQETNMIYVAAEHNNTLYTVNGFSNQIEDKIELNDPYDIAVDYKANTIYVTSDRAGLVYAIDGDANEIASTFEVADPCGVAVNPETGMVYVTSESTNMVHVIDGKKNELVAIIDVSESPRGVVVNEKTNTVYVTNQESSSISVIDGSTNSVIDSIDVGEDPRRVVVNPESNLVYVTNQGSNDVSVIDATDNSVIGSIPVNSPFEMAINPDSNKVYVTFFGTGELTIIGEFEPSKPELIPPQKEQVFGDIQEIDGYYVETVAENLKVPWAIAFSPDGRIFFTERVGNLRVIEEGQLLEPIKKIDVGGGEGGLLGITLDPNFEENHYIYLYYTYSDFFSSYNKVVRFTESLNQLSEEFVLLDEIPGQFAHDGGRLRFGPDGKLYLTTGDSLNSDLSQDLNSLAGKILRINPDGTVPDDNPFPNSFVYSLGHRNPQGLDWDPKTGKLVNSEHGPSGHDEINVIEAGKNYGWPEIVGDETNSKYISPILHTGIETWAPSGASFYDSDNISQWEGKFFVATLRGKHLRILDLDSNEKTVLSSESLFSGKFGRLRDASVGLDENLYLLTSNQDGRGSPAQNDDRILRIIPEPNKEEKILGDSSLSPLKQMQMGVQSFDVKCKQAMELLIKKSNGSTACVFTSSAHKLIERDWGRR